MNDKITSRHLSRKAIVYVRQSTALQLVNNEESRRLQYGMQDRLRCLGWSDIEVIDDDLGRSASGGVERSGFQRMVAEVSLGNVGTISARELSRFARNSREWQQLIEVCRFVDTLLIDQDAVYDARQGNDRLLLGLKGSLNEYELELLRLRAHEARRAKASRGEYLTLPATGYVKTEDDTLEKDPDLRVQEIIRLMFDKTLELGSVRQAMLWFRENALEIPISRRRLQPHSVTWRGACYAQFIEVATNPIYAGAYAFGRTEVTYVIEQGRPRRVVRKKPMSAWSVLIRDHHEAYVTWEEFERVQKLIAANSQKISATRKGAPKKGSALFSGLMRCHRCGRGLVVGYGGEHGEFPRYLCAWGQMAQGDAKCISFSALDVDREIGRLIVDVVRPGAIESAQLAAKAASESQDKLHEAMETELKAARYAADRAWRQFDAGDPENRLVVGELERRWNVALEHVREIERRLAEARAASEPRDLSSPDLFIGMAQELEGIWQDRATDVRLKKRIARTLIEEIVTDVDEQEHEIVLVIHWKGGVHTELRVKKKRRGENRGSRSADLKLTIRELALIFNDQMIACWLERAGVRTARGRPWARSLVTSFRNTHGIPVYATAEKDDPEAWISLSEVSSEVGVSWHTLLAAIRRGELEAKHPLNNGPWIVKRREVHELPLVRRLQQVVKRRGRRPAIPKEQLTLGISRT